MKNLPALPPSPIIPPPDRVWLDATEVAKRIGVMSRHSVLRIVRNDPSFPRPVKLHGKHARWSERSVDAWLDLRVTKIDADNEQRIEQALKKMRHA